ncbi:MAG: hypothetical protein ACHQF3_17375, partial [Alphaproteobacteria bacterium]
MTSLETLQAALNKLAEPQAASASPAQRIMDVVIAYGPALTDCVSLRAYPEGEKLLAEWKQLLDESDARLSANQRLWARGRYNSSGGFYWDSRALSDYFLNADFVESPRLFERAEAHHERAAEYLAKVEMASGAPAEAVRARDETVAGERREAMRVRGMKLLTAGEFELEAGALARARELL